MLDRFWLRCRRSLNAPYWAGALIIVAGFGALMFRKPA
jgi:hypothetical protein